MKTETETIEYTINDLYADLTALATTAYMFTVYDDELAENPKFRRVIATLSISIATLTTFLEEDSSYEFDIDELNQPGNLPSGGTQCCQDDNQRCGGTE